VVVGAGAGTPIGLICERAGPAASAARPENISKELERRFIESTNLFISNDNPASHPINTWLPAASPVASATQLLEIEESGFATTRIVANLFLSAAC
jgi:hypothetical protein